jgi:hypothetical protein
MSAINVVPITKSIGRNGIKGALAEFLRIANVVDKDSVGQIVLHINNGGVTKIQKDKWEVK